jgi:hypothetical protein
MGMSIYTDICKNRGASFEKIYFILADFSSVLATKPYGTENKIFIFEGPKFLMQLKYSSWAFGLRKRGGRKGLYKMLG